MASDLSSKLRAKDIEGRGLSKIDFTESKKKKVDLVNIYKGKKILCVGDSITNGSTAGAGNFYTDKLPRLIGTALVSTVIRKGFPGYRSDQILSIFDTEVVPNLPDIVVLLIGTNDAGQGRTLAEYTSYVIGILDKIQAIGAIPILCTVPPALTSGNDNNRRNLISSYNTWLRYYSSQNNIRLAEVHGRLVNIGTGDAVTGWFADLVHPNDYGHQYIAEAIADAFSGLAVFNHTINSVSVSNLISNPLFLTNGAGWYEQPGGTGNAISYSQKPKSGKIINGFCWEADWNQIGSNANGLRYFCTAITLASAGIIAGDKLLIQALIDIEDVEGGFAFAATAPNPNSYVQLRLLNQSFVPIFTIAPNCVRSPGPISYVYEVTAGVTQLILAMQMVLAIGRHVKIRIGEVGITKVTDQNEILALTL